MSTLDLFFLKDGKINKEKKDFNFNIKSGLITSSNRSKTLSLLKKKFIKFKIYPAEFIVDGEKDLTYFGSEGLCKLLASNRIFNSLRTPKIFLDELESLIYCVDRQLTSMSEYLPKVSLIEANITKLIEKFRQDRNPKWYTIYSHVKNIRDSVVFFVKENYFEMLSLYSDLELFRYDLIYDDLNLFKAFKLFSDLANDYLDLNKPIRYYSINELKSYVFDNEHTEDYHINEAFKHIEKDFTEVLQKYNIELGVSE